MKTITLYNFDELDEIGKRTAVITSSDSVIRDFGHTTSFPQLRDYGYRQWAVNKLIGNTSCWFYESGNFYGKDTT